MNQGDQPGVRIRLGFNTGFRIDHVERLVHTFWDLIGSVGGSLGLFIGFSFYGGIMDLYDGITFIALLKSRS